MAQYYEIITSNNQLPDDTYSTEQIISYQPMELVNFLANFHMPAPTQQNLAELTVQGYDSLGDNSLSDDSENDEFENDFEDNATVKHLDRFYFNSGL